jgi:hypothetical protein
MLNKILYSLCSEEVKLVLKRMEDRPSDFTHFQPVLATNVSQDPTKFKLTSPPPWAPAVSLTEPDRRWRMLIESGIFSRFESYVLRRRLRQLDIKATHQKIYEVLFK